jgi:hypothetical protein
VQATEIRVTHPQVVHHVLVRVKVPGLPLRDGIDGFFAARVPGNSAVIFPPGLARKLPKGSELNFEVHYTPNGIAVEDLPRIALKFATVPVKTEITAGSGYK